MGKVPRIKVKKRMFEIEGLNSLASKLLKYSKLEYAFLVPKSKISQKGYVLGGGLFKYHGPVDKNSYMVQKYGKYESLTFPEIPRGYVLILTNGSYFLRRKYAILVGKNV